MGRLAKQNCVIALTPFLSEALLDVADLLLPVGTFAETSGTYINVEGAWQSFAGVARPLGQARPGWKVLRVLGNLLEVDGFDYISSEEIREEFRGLVSEGRTAIPESKFGDIAVVDGTDAPHAELDIPLYWVDGIVRRARALQLTPAARRIAAQQGSAR